MGRYAVMLNAGPEEIGSAVNGLRYALDLDEHDHEVEVFLDGTATRWPGELRSRKGHPMNEYFEKLRSRDLLGGACRFCANAFDGAEGCEHAGIELLGEDGDHGPDTGALAAEGYQLVTVG